MKSNTSRRTFSLSRSGRSGFTLIEVLIAMLVLAFGLLGFALLQTMNIRFTKSAQQRTVATNLAYELIDLMRIQRSLGSYYNAISFDSFSSVTIPTTGCDRATAAPPSVNVNRWKCEVKSALPDGAADVNLEANGVVTVQVRWGDANWDSVTARQNSSVIVRSRL